MSSEVKVRCDVIFDRDAWEAVIAFYQCNGKPDKLIFEDRFHPDLLHVLMAKIETVIHQVETVEARLTEAEIIELKRNGNGDH